MNEDTDFELYLSISPAEYTIYLYDIKNLKNFYKKNFKLEQEQNFIDFKVLNNFIEKNIFKIEKLIGKFVRNISLIIENDEIINIELGVKKKNYEQNITENIFNRLCNENTIIIANSFSGQLGLVEYLCNIWNYQHPFNPLNII